MSRIDRISGRLPRFYRHWDDDSLVFAFLKAVSGQLDRSEERMTQVMKAHWVDSANGSELDDLAVLLGVQRFPDEDDPHFRGRLKNAVEGYKGGGTVSSILDAVRRLVNAKTDEDVKIVEHPAAPGSAEFTVTAGETWNLGSNSIEDADPRITLTVEEGGEVSDPQITNLDTDESVIYKGKLGVQQRLVIEDKKATVDGKKPPAGSAILVPRLLRRETTWRYAESLGRMVGVFDTAKFDEQTFAVAVPPVKIRFDWERRQPATFEVQVKSKDLRSSKLTKAQLERMLDSMKAAGVTAVVKVLE